MKSLISLMFVASMITGCEGEVVEGPTLSYDQDLRTTGAGHTDCSTVYCIAVECPEGFERHYTPNDCCGTCKPINPSTEGYCNTASQCEGLVHIQCVGDWTCEANACTYTCDTSTSF